MRASIAGVNAKINRAKKHIKELRSLIEEFQHLHSNKIQFHYNIETGQHFADVDIPEHPPVTWAVIVGDVVHNLRSAFDHLAWQLEILAGRVPDSHTRFPIYWEKTKFDNAVKGGMVKRFPRRAWTVIEGLQPYTLRKHAASNSLYVLHHLNIRDKHQLPNLLFAHPLVNHLEALEKDTAGIPVISRPIFGTLPLFREGPSRVKPGTIRLVLNFPEPRPLMDVYGKLALPVKFDEAGFGKGDPVLALLERLLNYTENVIARIVRGYRSLRP